jgi:hypothetical protein
VFEVVKESVMRNNLLKICVIVVSIICGNNTSANIQAGQNEAELKIVGEVKDVIIVNFEDATQVLNLFKDNGDKTDEIDRTFKFTILRLTNSGAKLQLSTTDGISYNQKEWSILKENNDGTTDKCVIDFSLLGTSKEGQLGQRAWDEEGNTYTFTEDDGVGEWCIIAEPVTKIKREKPGVFKGSLKISIVAG